VRVLRSLQMVSARMRAQPTSALVSHGCLLRRLDAQEAEERRIVLLNRHYVDDAQLAAVSSPDDLARLNEHRVMDPSPHSAPSSSKRR
jgi:hypothetical protein